MTGSVDHLNLDKGDQGERTKEAGKEKVKERKVKPISWERRRGGWLGRRAEATNLGKETFLQGCQSQLHMGASGKLEDEGFKCAYPRTSCASPHF